MHEGGIVRTVAAAAAAAAADVAQLLFTQFWIQQPLQILLPSSNICCVMRLLDCFGQLSNRVIAKLQDLAQPVDCFVIQNVSFESRQLNPRFASALERRTQHMLNKSQARAT